MYVKCVFVDMHAPHKYSFSRKEKYFVKKFKKKKSWFQIKINISLFFFSK